MLQRKIKRKKGQPLKHSYAVHTLLSMSEHCTQNKLVVVTMVNCVLHVDAICCSLVMLLCNYV